ncbi:MAG: CPBP family intramembrane metalloprotease [Planctomycetaceae bacterium]|nr:CPBP family intramembrane metalloprotease [Planctomycetaceae bacterium]
MSEAREESAERYWLDARRPLPSLLFLIPWIAAYEAGVILLGDQDPDHLRNGADYWMRSLLHVAGLKSVILLPVLVGIILLSWHLFRHDSWRIRLDTQIGMLAESILLAIALVAVGQMHDLVFRIADASPAQPSELTTAISGRVTQAVSFIGAGVYEEVMFRLLLVPVAWIGFRMFEFPPKWAAAMAAISTSFIFAMAHHIGPSADAFNLFTFSFRAAAGMFFATVFFLRGFGITVGCHAAYDLLVGVVLAAPETR